MNNSTYILKSILSLFIVLLFGLNCTFAQQSNENYLKQNITIHAENVTIAEILKELTKKTNVKFAYNPKLVKANKRTTIHSANKPANEVLEKILEPNYTLKSRGNYVIITPSKPSSDLNVKQNEILLSGFIIDDETNEGVVNASIFSSSGNSVVTDETGSFFIKLNDKDNSVLELRKEGYAPMAFDSERKQNSQLDIKIRAEKSLTLLVDDNGLEPIASTTSSNLSYVKTIFPINNDFKVNQVNIKDTLRKPVTFSIYPGLSTYGNLSGNIVYNFALNFVGYNRGIEGLEVAALSNINKEDVGSVQVAGLSNYVGGNIKGLQVAGIFNSVSGSGRGLQVGGIYNNLKGPLKGMQVAGILNTNHNNIDGLQVAGLSNYGDTINGLQIAGLSNVIDTFDGLQIGGINNYCNNAKGLQIAGIANQADTIVGTQISGIVNKARFIKGNQIGLINIADSITGVPIGLLSFVKKNAYKKIEISTDEVFDYNLGFTTGVKHFHSSLFIGAQSNVTKSENAFVTFGYTVGTSVSLGKALNFDIDLSSQYIAKRKFEWQESNKYKAYIGLDLTTFNKISIAAGVTFNGYNFDKNLLADSDYKNIRPSYIYSYDSNSASTVWRTWIGYKIGVRYAI